MYKLIQQHTRVELNELPKDENLVVFSMFNTLSVPLSFRSFSIKFVLEGCGEYQVNGRRYTVKNGEYLIANSLCEGSVVVDSKSLTTGVCIDIAPHIISEALSHTLHPDTPFPDMSLDKFFISEEFLENKYNTHNSKLGAILLQISRQLRENPHAAHSFGNEFYYNLADNIIADHYPIIAQLYGIKTVKHQTRKELYRRVCIGRTFLDNHLSEQISVKEAAEYAALSEYHFFRLFKSAFGITPQQYHIKKRLSTSLKLLHTENYSVTEASVATGFSDVFSFSKAFRKYFGISPSQYLSKKN